MALDNFDPSASVLRQPFIDFVARWSLPLMILDREYRFIYANQAYLTSVERKWDELKGRHVFDAFPDEPEKVQAVHAKFARTFEGHTTRLTAQPFTLINAKGEEELRNWQAVQEPYFDADGNVTHIVQYAEDVTDKVRADLERDMIAKEMDHRVKNMMAVIQSVARLSSRGQTSVEDFTQDLMGRIAAIGRNHSRLLTTDFSGTSLTDILTEELDVLAPADGRRYTLKGKNVIVPKEVAKDLSMIIHELATNAVKYGCFSRETGSLDISWRIVDAQLHLIWQECGVGPIGNIEREGFGTKLIKMIRSVQTTRQGTEDGLRAELTFTL